MCLLHINDIINNLATGKYKANRNLCAANINVNVDNEVNILLFDSYTVMYITHCITFTDNYKLLIVIVYYDIEGCVIQH